MPEPDPKTAEGAKADALDDLGQDAAGLAGDEETKTPPEGASLEDLEAAADKAVREEGGPREKGSPRSPKKLTKLDEFPEDIRESVKEFAFAERSRGVQEYVDKKRREAGEGPAEPDAKSGDLVAIITEEVERRLAHERGLQSEHRRVVQNIQEVFTQDGLSADQQRKMFGFLKKQEALGERREFDYRMLKTRAGVRVVAAAAGLYEPGPYETGEPMTERMLRSKDGEPEEWKKLPAGERIRRSLALKGRTMFGPNAS